MSEPTNPVEPTVESSVTYTSCQNFTAGHSVHWIPVLRVWVPEPRIKVEDFTHVEGTEFLVTVKGITKRMWNHDPASIIHYLNTPWRGRLHAVGDTGAFQSLNLKSGQWFYMSEEPVQDCKKARVKDLKDAWEAANKRATALSKISEFPAQAESAAQFLKHLDQMRILSNWNDHLLAFDVFGNPSCSCGIRVTNS